jgi:hypothetical protein
MLKRTGFAINYFTGLARS